MKACVLHAIGDLRLEERATPVPKRGEALVRVRACGICGSDIPRVYSKGTYTFPTIPGHEFAGEVVAVGADVDEGWIGRKVAVFPLIPCRRCPSCEIGDYALCADYDYMGSRSDGAFAEYISSPVWNLIAAPDCLSYEEIAMAEPAAVALHALRQAGLDFRDNVLITGAGPIGLLLATWARAWGANRVLLTDIDDDKLRFAERLGFGDVFNPMRGDAKEWVRSATGRGADVVIEGTGTSPGLDTALYAVRPSGKVVLMGNPSGGVSLSQDGYWQILRKQLTVRGTWNSSFASAPNNEWELAIAAMASGKLNARPLVTHRVPLEGVPDALVMMRDRTEFYNKVMYVNEST
ncbi:galactitol-1-phosphate 5-dehydrogenase [Cohnella sp. GCM10027633]|uniref:galactitol-1-phosphate 5-dehydrogenase n=1 Tax=unclassified Cohnella TaxID=2636738 RepID=UPI003641554F